MILSGQEGIWGFGRRSANGNMTMVNNTSASTSPPRIYQGQSPNKSCQIEQTNPLNPPAPRRDNLICIDQFNRVPLRPPPLTRAQAA